MSDEMPDFSNVQSGSSSTAPTIYEVKAGDSLSKIAQSAGLWQGPLQIEGSSKAIQAARIFFAEVGVSGDRLVFTEN